ncbi:MAG: hypothetical protein CMJ40_09510 [Phycisphaerae bacterium]|nr:hypothetical protein [Phycisphaerae bacterium]
MSALAGVTAIVNAEPISYLDINTSTGYSSNVSIDGIDIGNGNHYYGNQTATESFTVVTNMVGDSNTPMLGGNVQIANASSSDIDFVIGFYLPAEELDAGSYDWAGSISLALTGIDASLSSLLDTPVWSSGIGDVEMGTLLVDPFELAFDGLGSQATEEAISGMIDWNGDSGMLSVEFAFNLSAGDSVVFGTSLGFVPAPGAVSLLGLALLSGRRRRRSASPA